MAESRTLVLSLGANLGDTAATLATAVDALRSTPGITVTAVSPVYRTAPVGGVEQPDFVNLVVLATTSLEPDDVLAATAQIETAAGRTREVHWGPRTLDIDIIAIDGVVRDDAHLTLPHPRAHERAFVLVPWCAIDPDAVLPGHGRVADLAARASSDPAQRVEVA